ncbi:hypothetical protein PLICRDRAFT_111777 [Plicaturopsis crispa FD-325 SS-3]|nr:hypothetical protein PLICRDRAFT_111777 [Plicaturopsis crispa FD-325 SS-3]
MAILPLQFLEGPGSPPSAQTVSQEAPRPTRTLPLYIYSHHPVASPSDNSVVIKQSGSIEVEPPTRTLAQNLARPTAAQRNAPAKMNRRQDAPSGTTPPNMSPTPAPTGSSSPDTTVYITDEKNFALMLPKNPGEMISDAESDGVAFCAPGNADCTNKLPDGFITAAAFSKSPDNAWVQVTGCLDSSKFHFAAEDHGGQFDVRFPNGAQCTFGGYAASFIELYVFSLRDRVASN